MIMKKKVIKKCIVSDISEIVNHGHRLGFLFRMVAVGILSVLCNKVYF